MSDKHSIKGGKTRSEVVRRALVRQQQFQEMQDALVFPDDEKKRAELGVLVVLRNSDAENTMTKSMIAQQLWPRVQTPRPHAVPREQTYDALTRLLEAGFVAKIIMKHDFPAAKRVPIFSDRYHITEEGKQRMRGLEQEAQAEKSGKGAMR